MSAFPNQELAEENARIQALELFQRGRQPEAIALLMPFAHGSSNTVETLFVLCDMLVGVGRVPEAELLARMAVEQFPQFAESYVALTQSLLSRRPFDAHEEVLLAANQAVALAPTWAGVHLVHAHALAATGDRSGAIEATAYALSLAPDDEWLLTTAASLHLQFGDWKGAEDLARRALAANPGAVEAMTNLGMALQQQGQTREAADILNTALALDPTNDRAMSVLRWPLSLVFVILGFSLLLGPVGLVPASVVALMYLVPIARTMPRAVFVGSVKQLMRNFASNGFLLVVFSFLFPVAVVCAFIADLAYYRWSTAFTAATIFVWIACGLNIRRKNAKRGLG